MFFIGVRGHVAFRGTGRPTLWLLQGIPADFSSEGNVLGLVGHVVSLELLSWACCVLGKFCVGMVALTFRL